METHLQGLSKNDFMKIYLLNENGKSNRVIVFGISNAPENINELFSDHEIMEIQTNSIEVVYTSSQIHKDDSIRNIKKKIIQEIGEQKVCYDELYLFTNIIESVQVINLYQILTNKDEIPLTVEKVKQLLKNMNMDSVELFERLDKVEYLSFEDFSKIIYSDTLYSFSVSLGQKFFNQRNYLFPANPYNLLNNDGMNNTNENTLLSFENLLLLNYGKIQNNQIFVCFAEDVLNFYEEKSIDQEYAIQNYFPFLYRKSILSLEEFQSEKQKLIKENEKILDQTTRNYYKAVDLLYDIYHQRKTDWSYQKNGIVDIRFKIKSDMNIILPLEVIFKNIHCKKNIPFIKYNPGNRRENIYRFYTEKITRDGKNIPYLSESMISKIGKEIGNQKQISIFIQHTEKEGEQHIPFYLNIENDGDISIHTHFKQPILLNDLNELLKRVVQPVIDDINVFLEPTGYSIHSFESLQQPNLEIIHLKYSIETLLEKVFDYQKYFGCFSSIFDLIEENEKEGTVKMRYKRVENFREMDAQSLLITKYYKTPDNIVDVIQALMKNYKMTEETAKLRFIEYLNNYKDLQGKRIDNPGFAVSFNVHSFDQRLSIVIEDILSVEYLTPLSIYLDTLIRLTQDPKSTNIEIKEIQSLCSKMSKRKANDVSHVENVVATTVILPPTTRSQPIALIKKIEEIEPEEEGEDDAGVFFDDEIEEYDAVGDVIPEISKKDIETETPSSVESEKGIFFDEEEEEEEEFGGNRSRYRRPKKKGGIPVEEEKDELTREFVINPIGKPLKKNNIFYNKMKKLEPLLFSTEENKNFLGYSKLCPANNKMQPIILTQKEKEKIDRENPGSYTQTMKYGSDPNNPYYYICPRYWCLLSNTSMTEEDVKAGRCAKQGVPDKIIPQNATEVPKDAFVIEFNNPKEHLNDKGEYIPHYPGFTKEKNSKGFCLPCCYKKQKKDWDKCNQKEEGEEETLDVSEVLEEEEEEKEEKEGEPTEIQEKSKPKQKKQIHPLKKAIQKQDRKKNVSYIISNETFPIRDRNRFGFLPISIQLFLQTDSNACTTENNSALIKPNTECLLRYSVEQAPKQSILGTIADLYAYKQNLDIVPSVQELKEIMQRVIGIDQFIRYNNSYLISVFKPKVFDRNQIDTSLYEDSEFYKSIDIDNEYQLDFLEDTIAAYENFMDYLKKNDSEIDHTYLWDIITDSNPLFIKGGINLIILEVVDNDITDNVKVLCPTNSLSKKLFDPRKESVLVMKRDEFYEPIYLYKEENNIIKIKRTFLEQTAMKPLRNALSIIQKTTDKFCVSLPSLPKVYRFKKNISLESLFLLLKNYEYTILSQIMNYQGKIIGIVVQRKGSKNFVFVPCFPSARIKEMNDVPQKFMDDDDGEIWTDYSKTVSELNALHQKTNKKVLCSPQLKVIEDGLIVGILTETNQFVKIDPPSEDIYKDDYPVVNNSNYLMADRSSTTYTEKEDSERTKMIHKISLESQFYSSFRSMIRKIMNDFENRQEKHKLINLFDDDRIHYKKKLQKIINILRKLSSEKILFSEFDEKVLKEMNEIYCSSTHCEDPQKSYCIRRTDGNCQLIIPKFHLISGVDNDNVYYTRIADELIRYKRVRLFMTQPKTYLNITTTDYQLNNDEFIILQSSLSSNYFKDLVPFNIVENIQNVAFEVAKPDISQVYSNEVIPLSEQNIESNENIDNLNDLIVECIDKTVEVIGNPSESIWKRIFPKKSKEIIFKNSSPQCSFYVLLAIFQDKYKQPVSIQSVRNSLAKKYVELMANYKTAILSVWKHQGKEEWVNSIEKGVLKVNEAVLNEEYFITDLDIWLFSSISRLQICLFSKNMLKTLDKNLEWILFGKDYNEKHYFIRSPAVYGSNKIPSYHLVMPAFGLGELGEFENMVQQAVSGKNTGLAKNIQSLDYFLQQK
jgi:hypothetical protein